MEADCFQQRVPVGVPRFQLDGCGVVGVANDQQGVPDVLHDVGVPAYAENRSLPYAVRSRKVEGLFLPDGIEPCDGRFGSRFDGAGSCRLRGSNRVVCGTRCVTQGPRPTLAGSPRHLHGFAPRDDRPDSPLDRPRRLHSGW